MHAPNHGIRHMLSNGTGYGYVQYLPECNGKQWGSDRECGLVLIETWGTCAIWDTDRLVPDIAYVPMGTVVTKA